VIDPFVYLRVPSDPMHTYPRSLVMKSILTSIWRRVGHLQKARSSLPLLARSAPSRDGLAASVRMRTRTGFARTILFWRSAAQWTQYASSPHYPGCCSAKTLRRQCQQALPSIRRAFLLSSIRSATDFYSSGAKTLPFSSSINIEATTLPRNDLTFATLTRTRAIARTAGSALKSSTISDNALIFWPWAL
jgi:hypothetical protein